MLDFCSANLFIFIHSPLAAYRNIRHSHVNKTFINKKINTRNVKFFSKACVIVHIVSRLLQTLLRKFGTGQHARPLLSDNNPKTSQYF